MKKLIYIFIFSLINQNYFAFQDYSFFLIKAHSLEKNNKIQKSIQLYQKIANSDAPKKYRDHALNKLNSLKKKDNLESNFDHLHILENQNCMVYENQIKGSFHWDGVCDKGLVEGPGKLYILENQKKYLLYSGKMKKGKKFSYGLSYRKDKSLIYMGNFFDNNYHGEGKLYFQNGELAYSGSFANGKKTGKSKSYRPNGAMLHIGEYKDNYFQGPGIVYFEDGETYDGMIVNSYREGPGIFKQLNNVTWDGDFSQGQFIGRWEKQIPQGEGSKHWVVGTSYKGGWKNKKRHFYGTQTWPSGKTYSGYWENDLRHGEGTIVYPEGHTFKGIFSEDQIKGFGEFKFVDGSSYEGNFVNNQMHGNGVWTTKSGDVLELSWNFGELLSSENSKVETQNLIQLKSIDSFLIETYENGLILTQK